MLSTDWYMREIPTSNFFVQRAISWGHQPDVVIRDFIANDGWKRGWRLFTSTRAATLNWACCCCGLPNKFCVIEGKGCYYRLSYNDFVNMCYHTNGGPWLTDDQDFYCRNHPDPEAKKWQR